MSGSTSQALDAAEVVGAMNSSEIVARYLEFGFRIVTWPQLGDDKGPRQDGWTSRVYTLDDFRDGNRVGIMSGHEIAPGSFFSDVDIDWAEGGRIASHFLPATEFVYGRAGKRVSHCGYATSEALTSLKYEDPSDKTTLIELRGTKLDGSVGLQSMAPPSIWSKQGKTEPLAFVKFGAPSLVDPPTRLRQRPPISSCRKPPTSSASSMARWWAPCSIPLSLAPS